MRKTKEQKAITLIALIITIIVLLILALVTINAVRGDGIILRAQEARNEYSEAQAKEKVALQLEEWKILKHTQGDANLGNFLTEKFEAENVIANEDGTYTVKVDGYGVIVDANGNVTGITNENSTEGNTEGEKTTYTWTDNGDGTFTSNYGITVAIGDKVAYNEGIGKTSSIDSSFLMDDLEWRILDIEEDGTIELISTQPTTSTFRVYSDEWLYSETKLDTLCNDLYGSGEGAASARNLKVEDIDKLARITTDTDKQALDSNYGRRFQYKYSTDAGYMQSRISTDNGSTWSDWENITSSGYQRFSEPGKEQINSSNTSRVADLTYTYYSYKISDHVTSTTSDGISIASLITQGLNDDNNVASGSDSEHWLSSRCIQCYSTWAIYEVRIISSGLLKSEFVTSSSYVTAVDKLAIRPVVSLSKFISLTNESGVWKVNT